MLLSTFFVTTTYSLPPTTYHLHVHLLLPFLPSTSSISQTTLQVAYPSSLSTLCSLPSWSATLVASLASVFEYVVIVDHHILHHLEGAFLQLNHQSLETCNTHI